VHFSLTVADRILVLLADYAPFPEPLVFPRDVTQEGLSETLGTPRGYVAQQLKNLIESGHVAWCLGRVADYKKRLKVYFATETGVAEAKFLLKTIDSCAVRSPAGDCEDGGTVSRFGGGIPKSDPARGDLRQTEPNRR